MKITTNKNPKIVEIYINFVKTLVKFLKSDIIFLNRKRNPFGLHCSMPVSLYRSGLQQENKCISFLVDTLFLFPI